MIMINESKPNHMLFKPKMHNYNKKVTSNINSNKLLSPGSQAPQVANSVVIIHQNNSISTNCEPNVMSTTSTPIKTQPVLNKPDETATRSTAASVNNNMVLSNGNDNDLNELKYMKGYVNVLKERFTRKTNAENEKNGPTMEHILHRRSISPYAVNKASAVVKSPPNNVMNENTKKMFTSSDDLRNPVKIVTNCGSLVKNKIKYLSNTALNTASSVATSHHHQHGASSGCLLSPNSDYKCGMSYDKINKDELPKPNFVSSVKNLFEKQIHNAACSSSLNNSLNTSTSNHAASVDFSKLNSSFNSSTVAAAASTSLTKSPIVQATSPAQTNNQYDISLVDRLRQNGTVVYEHADTNSQQSNGLDKRESLSQQAQQNSVSIQPPVSNPTSPFNNKSNSANSNNNSTKFVVSSKTKPPAPPPPSLPPPSIKKSPLLPSNSNTIHNHHHSNNSQNDSDKENENSTNGVNSMTSNTTTDRFLTIKERKEFFSKPPTSAVQPGRLQKRFKSESSVSNDWSTRTSESIEHVVESEPKSPVRMNGHASRSSNVKISSLSVSQVMLEDAHSNETADYDDQIDVEPNELGVDEDDNSISANQILTSAKQKKEINTKAKTNVKMKTFFGGEEIKNLDELKSMKPVVGSSRTNNDTSDSSVRINNSIEFFNFEFIGAEVKLEKSILIVRRQDSSSSMSNKKLKKVERVNFVEEAPETYEYPSFEFMLKEMGIDPASDPDYQIVPGESDHEDDDDQEKKPSYTQFLPGLITESSDFDDNKNNTYSKLGSFTNFKPSCLTTSYELGSIESFEKRLSGHYDQMKAEYEETSKDILPSRDEDLKRWSCEMDANILF